MPATKKELDAARAQEQEAETGDGYITVPLAGHDGVTKDVRAFPAGKWRASALRALNQGDIDAFMTSVLHEDDFDIFVDLDPDTEGFGKFTEDAARLSGGDLGKSSGRTRSGSSTRRS
ncbi:hypothetical protein OG785_45770 [Streptomyces sp. NBC_00006]|uniref:hypothetical protein n=1 Tax=Streptomyces sp. NBC_00006 TaxID=2975619 RepID=UPI00224EFB33|nr:hypothetical protein [Streptomyces sp. NBC_00006]MCX5537719.1 hypothetical protein [Streptomyces sp. NBC_00006]MCX5537870.1 hypothetical protein [Streptomyces sp. NBC_00006]